MGFLPPSVCFPPKTEAPATWGGEHCCHYPSEGALGPDLARSGGLWMRRLVCIHAGYEGVIQAVNATTPGTFVNSCTKNP